MGLMSPRRRAGDRGDGSRSFMIGLAITLILLLGLAAAFQPSIRIAFPRAPSGMEVQLKPSEDIELERKYGPLAPVVKSFKDVGDAFASLFGGGSGAAAVGLETELGYTSTTGQTISFLQSFSGVGMIGMSGVFVKSSLGDYKALKLYDAERNAEGEVWVRPSVRIKTFEGVPAEWDVAVKIMITVDGEVIDEAALTRRGSGTPPEKIELDKVSIRGKAFYALLLGEKEMAKKLIRRAVEAVPGEVNIPNEPPKGMARQICFHADYRGAVRFEGEDEPSIKEVKGIKLGCFNFEFKQTGAFEMIVDKDVTVAPLAEVFLTGESGMQGLTPMLETMSATITRDGTTYVVTNVITKWQTTTITTTRIVTERYPVTVTITVTKVGNIIGPLAGVLLMKWPYSEFIFIAGGG
ncbi:MAG: hypothetical protein QW692_02110 [Nitrososphaerota archaeon]